MCIRDSLYTVCGDRFDCGQRIDVHGHDDALTHDYFNAIQTHVVCVGRWVDSADGFARV